MAYWGYHLMLDCSGCNLEQISSKENVANFTKALVKNIDMVAHGEPVIVYFAEHDPSKAGLSLMQLIVTSSITGHFVDRDRHAYLDVFSCKPFDIGAVEDTVKEYFGAEKIRVNFVTRHAD
jgi:S-adenosylmethionine decarboxylase